MKFSFRKGKSGPNVVTTKNLAASLRDERLKSGIILNAIEDGVVLVDGQGTIQLFNPGASAITGSGSFTQAGIGTTTLTLTGIAAAFGVASCCALPILLASASGPVAPSPDCTIKGNVNRAGECIYHQPSSRWYAKLQMNVGKGTRWFCSVEDAEAAGCRETKR